VEEKLKKIIRETFQKALDSIEVEIDRPEKIDGNTPVYGSNGYLDSLSLINFVMALEKRIRDEFKTSVTIVNETAMSNTNSPFRNIDTLSNYIYSLLKENADER
jgi:acyl carrier protein